MDAINAQNGAAACLHTVRKLSMHMLNPLNGIQNKGKP
jgi:hypothetical protein